jgi:UPF0716 protein FxsA
VLVGRLIGFVIIGGFFAELAMFIVVGQRIGVLAVIALVILSAAVGGSAIRAAGMGLAAAMRRPVGDSNFASREAASRFLLMLAGILLVVPGFLSDIAGLVLLVPTLRHWLARRLMAKVEIRHADARRDMGPQGPIIEGEAIEIEGVVEPPPRQR